MTKSSSYSSTSGDHSLWTKIPNKKDKATVDRVANKSELTLSHGFLLQLTCAFATPSTAVSIIDKPINASNQWMISSCVRVTTRLAWESHVASGSEVRSAIWPGKIGQLFCCYSRNCPPQLSQSGRTAASNPCINQTSLLLRKGGWVKLQPTGSVSVLLKQTLNHSI